MHQPVGNQFSLNSVSHDSVTSHEQLKTDHASNNSTMLRAGIYEIPSHTSHIPSFSVVGMYIYMYMHMQLTKK